METIAIYWEEKVKIYGITVKEQLALVSLFPADGSAGAIAALAAHCANKLDSFILTSYQLQPTPQLDLVIPESKLDGIMGQLSNYFDNPSAGHFTVVENVNILSMHGPHFQERFGIAEIAVTALLKENIPLLLNCCTGTSLQLVISTYWCEAAYGLLQQTFTTPTSF